MNQDGLRKELELLSTAVQDSWMKDVQKVEEYQRIEQILKEILQKDAIEDYFQSHDTYEYFINTFSNQVVEKLLMQSTVFGENGEQIAFEILKSFVQIFIKFKANPNYTKLWDNIKSIFDANRSFYQISHFPKTSDSLKSTTPAEFNLKFLKLKNQKNEENAFEKEQELDVFIETRDRQNSWVWVRGIICNVFDNQISVRTPVNETPSVISKNSYEIAKAGTYTKDWDWRLSLKEGDIIDCYERDTYYPATIIERNESEYRGLTRVDYNVAFRLFLDQVPDIEKYKLFWKNNCYNMDRTGRKYLGDPEGYDEKINFYSKRLCQRDSKIWIHKGQRINASVDYSMDDLFEDTDQQGKPVITIGRSNNFNYFYNLLINHIGQQGFLEDIINSLQSQKTEDNKKENVSNEVICLGFYILRSCADYLFKNYALKLASMLKEKAFDFLNSLSNENIRGIKKESIEIISETLKKYLGILYDSESIGNEVYEQFEMNFDMKMIKTTSLEKRNAALKRIVDLIRFSHYDKEKQRKILDAIKANKVIYEIFGPNSHVQLISKSKELIHVLLESDRLDEEDLNLIWNCTKNGDLEAKYSVLKIFKEISHQLSTKIIKTLLLNMLSNNEGDLVEDELSLIFEFVSKLVRLDEYNDIISQCVKGFIKYLIKNQNKERIELFLNKVLELSKHYNIIKHLFMDEAIRLIQTEHFVIGFNILHAFQEFLNVDMLADEDIKEKYIDNNYLINLFEAAFDKYISSLQSEALDEQKHNQISLVFFEFLLDLINTSIWTESYSVNPVDFIYDHLVAKKISSNDSKLFYSWSSTLIGEHNSYLEKVYEIFTTKICQDERAIQSITSDGFDLYFKIVFKINQEEISQIDCDNIKCQCHPQELKGFDLLWNIIFKSESKEIMTKGILLLNQLFKTYDDEGNETLEGSQNLIGLCIKELKKGDPITINKSFSMLYKIIEESEKFGTADIVSHGSLLNRNKHNIIIKAIAINDSRNFSFTADSNSTIFAIKKQISKRVDYHFDFIKFTLMDFTGKLNNTNYSQKDVVLDYQYNGRTLYSMGLPHDIVISIVPNGIEKEIPHKNLKEHDEPTEETMKMFNEWFDKFSENGKMTQVTCGQFVKAATNSKENIGPTDTRVVELFKERDSNGDGLLEREEFLDFYVESVKTKESIVRENMHAMGYRNDLKRMNEPYFPENSEPEKMPRYQLATNEDFFEAIFDAFLENSQVDSQLADKINLSIFSFINQLVTNPKIYNKIIEFQSSDDLSQILNVSNPYKMIYSLEIVEYIIDNISKENHDIKYENWVKLFIENGGYEYLIKIFLNYLSEIKDKSSKSNLLCFSALIRNIKLICINAHNTAYNILAIHLFLKKNNLCNKIISAITSNEIVTNLLTILNRFISTNEDEIVNEIFELISFIIPIAKLTEEFKKDIFLDIIKKGVLSNNIFISQNFSHNISKMVDILDKNSNYLLANDIINFLFTIIQDYINQSSAEYANANSEYLFDLFSNLIENVEKANFKDALFFNIDYYKSICNKILQFINQTYDGSAAAINEVVFVGLLKLVSTMAKKEPAIKEYISNETTLVNDILTKMLFYYKKNKPNESKAFVTIEEENINNNNTKNKSLIKKECYNFIINMLEDSVNNLEKFFEMDIISNLTTEDEEQSMPQTSNYFYYRRKSDEKKREGYVGLKNLGCICYMNSSMQQFFMVPTLRYGLLRFDNNEPENWVQAQERVDDNLFHQTQKLLSYLQLSQRMDYNPFGFTFAFKDFEGNPTRIVEQKDAQEFLSIFFDRIENACKSTKYKYLIQNIFGGKNCSQIICENCHKVKNRYEDMLFLSLQVKNMKTINDSLLKQIAEEKIDGYECEGCKKKVTIKKRNILASLPNVLIIHLQRIFYNFEYDHNEKINSYLEFPRHLNLKPYTLEALSKAEGGQSGNDNDIYFRADEYYNYYLVGVVVHIGSADSGHYYSYINTVRGGEGDVAFYDESDSRMDNCWLEFNDSHISKFNIEGLERECFGGSTGDRALGIWGNSDNCKNAYLLVYERKLKMPLKKVIPEGDVDNLIKQGQTLVEMADEDEVDKNERKYDILRYYGTELYEKMKKEAYQSIFHNKVKEEYYIYRPFYFDKKKVPVKYYSEIQMDNANFEKHQNIDDKDFAEFIQHLVPMLENVLMNSQRECNKLTENYLNFVFNMLSKKARNDCNESIKKLLNISMMNTNFRNCLLEYIASNDSVSALLINDEEQIIKALCELIYKLIEDIYNKDSATFIDYYSHPTSVSESAVEYYKTMKILVKIMERFPQISNRYIMHIEPILCLFNALYKLHPSMKAFFKEIEYIPKMVTFLLGKDSPCYNKTKCKFGNWDYGVRPEIPNPLLIIEVLYDMSTKSSLVLKDGFELEFNDDEESCLLSAEFIKYVYGKSPEYFLKFLVLFNENNLAFTIFSCGEIIKNLDGLRVYNSREEIKAIVQSSLQLMRIKDQYQRIRMEILLGIPQYEISNDMRGNVFPLIGYHSMQSIDKQIYSYKSPVYQSENLSTIISKLIEIKMDNEFVVELFIEILNEVTINKELCRYISVLPFVSLSLPTFVHYGLTMIKQFGNENEAIINELQKNRDKINHVFEDVKQDQMLVKTFPGFVNEHQLFKNIKREEVTKVYEEGNIVILMIEYYADYIDYTDSSEIDFGQSRCNQMSIYSAANEEETEIVEEENLQNDGNQDKILVANLDDIEHDSDERLLSDISREFKEKNREKIIIQNKYSVKNSKAILRRFVINVLGYCDGCLCMTFKRKKEYEKYNEYLPEVPLLFKINYNTPKDIFNVSKLDNDKDWTFTVDDISFETNNSFFKIEFPSNCGYGI